MFGVIVAGRLVQGSPQQVNENQFLFLLESADSIKHLVIFMTGEVPFTDGFGGSIYLGWPGGGDSGSEVAWQYLGHIANDKPSAIFKVNQIKLSQGISNPFGAMPSATGLSASIAQLGIVVEPLAQIANQTPAAGTVASVTESVVQYTQKMLESLYNYATSFAITQAQMTPQPSESFIPASVLQRWYENFQRRLQLNPTFWKD